MLRSTKAIMGFRLGAEDGAVGRCKDLLFDERHWTIRYVAADTGTWLPKRRVIIAPTLFGDPDWRLGEIPVRLTKQQIEGAPHLDSDAPVSRRYERAWLEMFRQPYYWLPTLADGPLAYVDGGALTETGKRPPNEATEDPEAATHLRSTEEVTGYKIRAKDGHVGHVEEFIVDDTSWVIRYMVVDTRNWFPGRKVLIAPSWITAVSRPEREVSTALTADEIKNSPEYAPYKPINREYEVRLYDYYGRPHYW